VVWQERTYFVASQGAVPGGWRYVLEPWPEDRHEAPGNVVHYDEGYVHERDALRREQEAVGLWMISPLLGFLPSGTKLRLNERYGFHPVVVTERSVLLEHAALLMLLGTLAIFALATGFAPGFGGDARDVGGPPFFMLFLAAVFLAVDRVVRQHRLLTGSMRQYGFAEWVVRRLGDDPASEA
jgi:hypothetical protein